jgi:hypothetical protein
MRTLMRQAGLAECLGTHVARRGPSHAPFEVGLSEE